MSPRIIVAAADALGTSAVAAVAREVSGAVGATVDVVLVASSVTPEAVDSFVDEAGLAGRADRILAYEVPAGHALGGATLAAALVDAAAGDDVHAVLLAEGPFAREAAARTAVRLGGSCASMCSRLQMVAGDGVRIERPAYGGVASAGLTLNATPACVVLAPGQAPPGPATGGPAPVVEARRLAVSAVAGRVTVLAETSVEKTCDLEHAKVIVSVGRGFAKSADLEIIGDLVELLGAEVGCSRPIAEDFKWLEKEHLVGLTGASVTPELYLALGISGQVQHLAGIKDAKIVAAVNSDPRSPILKNADYAIVADLYKVVPALTEFLRERHTNGTHGG